MNETIEIINARSTLKEWLKEEKSLYLGNTRKRRIKTFLLYDHDYVIWKFVHALRICEYHYNTGHRLRYVLWQNRKNHIGAKIGITAWHNTLGKGVRFWHYGSVIINGYSKIGTGCQFHGNNCIGNKGENHIEAPVLGNRVKVGVGAKVLGNVYVADDVKIGANAVVVKSCYKKGATLVGIPAREVIKNEERK